MSCRQSCHSLADVTFRYHPFLYLGVQVQVRPYLVLSWDKERDHNNIIMCVLERDQHGQDIRVSDLLQLIPLLPPRRC
jgi:hypothetical protein